MNRFFNNPAGTPNSFLNYMPANSTVSPYLQRPTVPTAVPPPVYPPIIQNFGVPQQNSVQTAIPNQTNILWVDDESEIAAYPSGRGWQQWFGNKNDQILYVRETDTNGNPQPVVKLKYEVVEEAPKQETASKTEVPKYDGPSREEFDKLTESVNMLVDKLGDLLK